MMCKRCGDYSYDRLIEFCEICGWDGFEYCDNPFDDYCKEDVC